MKRWLQKRSKVDCRQMAQALQIQEATACVLANRGIGTYQQAMEFLQKIPNKHRNPFLMKDFQKGIELVTQAIQKHLSIVIYGDYDVDGVMSTSILYKALGHCGARVQYYIPHRQQEGYGLNQQAVRALVEQGMELLITSDNGIAALEEIALAKELGCQVLVIDHHEPAFETHGCQEREDILPKADAIIDPKQADCSYPFSLFCAGGLAYKFACAFLKQNHCLDKTLQKEWLVLASIATVCDIVDLKDENRVLAKTGLKYATQSGNLGLNMLLDEAGLAGKTITEFHFGFVIGPCINAVGRLESATLAVKLFTENNPQCARQIAKTMVELNQKRKDMTKEATEKALDAIEHSSLKKDNVLVLYQEDVHESIAGIVAGRIKEKWYRPVIVLTKGETMAKGSARSIEGYNIFEALLACKELFQRFGGHAMAAGLSLETDKIDCLRKRLNEDCKLTKEEMMAPLKIEKQLSFSQINLTLAQELKWLAPFGKGNPSPLFGTKRVCVERIALLGKEKQIVRMELVEEKTMLRYQGISFDGYEKFCNLLKQLYPQKDCDRIFEGGKCHMVLDFVYSVDVNSYQGRNSVQLQIKDFRISK